jgi:two-component system, NtrC family, response regulator PilR
MREKKYRVLVVDDEAGMREVLQIVLENAGYQVILGSNVEEAIAYLEKGSADLVLTDLYMGKDRNAGLTLLEYLQKNQPLTPAIMITAHGTVQSAVEAMRLGAIDYLQKPFNSNDEILLRIQRAIEQRELVRENQAFLREQSRTTRPDSMVGNSPAFRKVLAMVNRVAALPSTVAIHGESGVGKELVARALHNISPRSSKPFVAINCGGIPETLLESELFGYKKGAFTGANQDKEGLFVVANGGTIFLDEIGEMPPILQVKLLRVLDNNCVTPVGSISSTTVDVRVISATNRDLADMVENGHFRKDLFYRLNVIPIYVPPLRDRAEDIPLLARHLILKHAESMGCSPKALSPEAESALLRNSWPGNVRELSNALERALGLSANDTIEIEDLPPEMQSPQPEPNMKPVISEEQGIDLEALVAELESDCIRQALEVTHYSQQKAAKLLGLTARSLRYRLDKYDMTAE